VTRALNNGKAFGCAAIAVLSFLMPFLCATWLLSGATLVQAVGLTALSVLSSGVIALMEPVEDGPAIDIRARRENGGAR
jgi:hypothetical protein